MNSNTCIFINKKVKTNLLFNPECFSALFHITSLSEDDLYTV